VHLAGEPDTRLGYRALQRVVLLEENIDLLLEIARIRGGRDRASGRRG
jgi:hypothetical protein